jgi:type IV pilus assembly protein PilE
MPNFTHSTRACVGTLPAIASRRPIVHGSFVSFTRQRRAGFTLIEVMITVAIIAILAAVALPSYRDYVMRGRITEATNALSETRARLEQFYQDNRHYGSSADGCGVAMPAGDAFDFTCSSGAGAAPWGTNQAYLIVATGTGGMAGFVYTVDHQGRRRTTGLPAGWGEVPRDCWVTRRGGTC